MATASIILPIPPTSFDPVAPAALSFYAEGTEQHNVHWMVLFDDSDSEWCYWQFQLPANYASAPVLHLTYSMASANTTDDVVLGASVGSHAEGETGEGDTWDTENSLTETVDDTAGDVNVTSITLTNNDSMAANEFVMIKFRRDGGNGSDAAAGDLELLTARLDYTTT